MRLVSIICGILFISMNLSAQKGWELGPWLGVSNYFGDLNTTYDVLEMGPSGGVLARYNFNNRINAKISLNYAYIYGDDKDSPNSFENRRNLSFGSHIGDAAGQIEFNFLPYIHGSRDYYFTPYLGGGINVFAFNPRANYEGQRHNLRPLGTEGQPEGEEYNVLSGGLVISGGFKWDINDYWSINIELSGRRLFTDYLDDVSTVYANPAALRVKRGELSAALADRSEGEKIGTPGKQRGNSRDNDTYTMLGVSLVYYFGKLECPDLSNKNKW